MFQSDQVITVSILLNGNIDEFFCSFVYASNGVEERKQLWDDLQHHHNSSMFQNKLWMVCGDFNETLQGQEHSNYIDDQHTTMEMMDFQNVVRDCSLVDLKYHGPPYTWCNKRYMGLICKILDIFLVERYPNSYCVFESGGCFDHLRRRTTVEVEEVRKFRPFKFANVLTQLKHFP